MCQPRNFFFLKQKINVYKKWQISIWYPVPGFELLTCQSITTRAPGTLERVVCDKNCVIKIIFFDFGKIESILISYLINSVAFEVLSSKLTLFHKRISEIEMSKLLSHIDLGTCLIRRNVISKNPLFVSHSK